MMSKLVLILLLTSCVFCDNTDELLSVIVIYRHGDRTPLATYPTDPYRNGSFWPEGSGQLTNQGKLHQFELGKWLRQRYDGFLSSRYQLDEIYVRSTDVDRTLMSAEANLAGLYQPEDDQIWNPDLKWQPIPVHTVPESDDAFLAMKKNCPKYTELLQQLFESPYFQEIDQQNRQLYNYLTTWTGSPITTLKQVKHIFTTLFIEKNGFNLVLPEWSSTVYPEILQPLAALSFATGSFTPELARLKTGIFFQQLLEHFKNISKKVDNRKFLMFSAHDSTVANLLSSIGAFQRHCPPYASIVIFELRRGSTDYVNVFYKNSTEPQNITVKGCKFDCNLDDLVEILHPITLTQVEWENECQLQRCRWVNAAIIFGGFIAFLGVMLTGLVLLGHKRGAGYVMMRGTENV